MGCHPVGNISGEGEFATPHEERIGSDVFAGEVQTFGDGFGEEDTVAVEQFDFSIEQSRQGGLSFDVSPVESDGGRQLA